MQDKNPKRFMKIPGEDKFVYDFKFATRLPPALPTPKTLFIPLDQDRHTKHRFTKLSFFKKQDVLPGVTLGIPFTDLTMNAWKFNLQDGQKKQRISPKDMELLTNHLEEEDNKQNIKKYEKSKDNVSHYLRETTFIHNTMKDTIKQEEKKAPVLQKQRSHVQEFQHRIDIKHVQEQGQKRLRKMLNERIEETFLKVKKVGAGIIHPKKGLKAKKIYQFQPDFPILHMSLASIKNDKKLEKLSPGNQNLLCKYLEIGHMEFLELYETCIEDNNRRRIEPEDLVDKHPMKNKLDFQKRFMCEFGNLQSLKEQNSTSSANLLLNFNQKRGIIKFSRLSESLILRNRADIKIKKGKKEDDAFILTKCIRLFPRAPTLVELQTKKKKLMEIDVKLQKRVNIEIANNVPNSTDYESYLPIPQIFGDGIDPDEDDVDFDQLLPENDDDDIDDIDIEDQAPIQPGQELNE